MNATSCLDVINSLFNNPRLWQGREDQDVSKELSEKNQFVCSTLTEAYLGPCQTSMIKLFCENGERFLV